MSTEDYHAKIDALKLMRWQPRFHGPVHNVTAPGGWVDMWAMVDSETGETIVSVGVPTGRSDIAGYIAACCSNRARLVTDIDRRDLALDGIADPEGILATEARAIADALYTAYTMILEATDKAPNGWTLNDAIGQLWFAFCGQLSHDMRGRLLFRFLQLATTDWKPEDEPSKGDDA